VAGHASAGGLAVYLPLARGERSLGVLVVERDRPGEPDETQLRTIQTVGAQIALFAENVRLLDSLRRTFDSSVEAVASAVEARDGYTEAHCRRLAAFSVLMAHRLGLDAEETEAIRLGALLHDVGKIGIRDEVLLKAGRLSAEERAEMQRHAVIGHRVVQPIHGLSETTIHCVRHHHERWNGAGYPDGLAGEAIPLGARIVSIVDVWDALSTDRPYKRAYPQTRVREMLAKERGEQFDPALVDLFLELLDEEGEAMLALGRPLAEAAS
jgi:HD-GYP domain-containing protein (c-di-GMP phosphodiesterase class II)